MKLLISLKVFGEATVRISVNGSLKYEGEAAPLNSVSFDPREFNLLQIEHYGKMPYHHGRNEDRAIEIDGITLDGHEIIKPVLYNYPIRINGVDRYNDLYIGHNGVFTMPFYGDNRERYNQYWLNEEQQHRNQSLNNDTFNRYGEEVSINEDTNMTIFDLERHIGE